MKSCLFSVYELLYLFQYIINECLLLTLFYILNLLILYPFTDRSLTYLSKTSILDKEVIFCSWLNLLSHKSYFLRFVVTRNMSIIYTDKNGKIQDTMRVDAVAKKRVSTFYLLQLEIA